MLNRVQHDDCVMNQVQHDGCVMSRVEHDEGAEVFEATFVYRLFWLEPIE